MRASATQAAIVLAAAGMYATYVNRVRLFYTEGTSYFLGEPSSYNYRLNAGEIPARWLEGATEDLFAKNYNVHIIDRLLRTSKNITEINGRPAFTGEPIQEVVDTTLAKMTLKEFAERHPYTPGLLQSSTDFVHGPKTTRFDWKYGTSRTKRLWVIKFEPSTDGPVYTTKQYQTYLKNTQTYIATPVNHSGFKPN